MDMSKLPRLSKTESNVADPDQSPVVDQPPTNVGAMGYQVPTAPADRLGAGAEIWIGLIVGLLFLALGRSFGAYLWAGITHQPFHTNVMWDAGPQAGTEAAYPDLEGGTIYSDSGFFVFGVALIVAGIAQFLAVTRVAGWRALGYLALSLSAAATAYNLFVCAKLMAIGITPILSLLCVAFGGYEVYLAYRSVRPLAPPGRQIPT